MLRLRLEVQTSENVQEICAQSTRIATLLGIEVAFELNGKDVTAKPGMRAENLVYECDGESPKTVTKLKGTGKKNDKEKEPTPDTAQKDVQQDTI